MEWNRKEISRFEGGVVGTYLTDAVPIEFLFFIYFSRKTFSKGFLFADFYQSLCREFSYNYKVLL